MAYNSKIEFEIEFKRRLEFEIQLRTDITSFVRRCEAAYRRITKMKAPYCFLTHWFYYQLTVTGVNVSDVFIRDIDSKRSKELLRELVVIAMKNEANADFVVSAILNEAKTYLKKRASASRELTNSSTEEIAKNEDRNSSTEEIAKIEDKKTDSSKIAKRQPISLTALASFELKDEYKPDISAFIARSLAPPEHKQEQLEVIKDSIVYHRLKDISVKATEQTEFGKPSESRESRSKSVSVKATRRMRDRLKNMYKKPISECFLNTVHSEIEFLADAFCMLYRYETLNLIAKETMQLSAPDFEYLSLLKIGFQLECFASPINSHLKYFCSAFKDTDECFGSLGSFFELSDEFFDKDLKCTCDTPYQLDAIELNVDKVISILDKYSSKRKLEFRFILPYWADADYVQKLKDTKYQTSYEIKESYSYVLHKASTDEKKSIVPCATLRVTLQSK